mgnify:CR=1 FL=1
MRRRDLLGLTLAAKVPATAWCAAPADPYDGDPFRSFQWPELKKEFLGAGARTVFDARVKVMGPAFAEDAAQAWIVDPTSGQETTIPRARKPFTIRCVFDP